MEINTILPWFVFGLGVTGRVVLPYLQARFAADEPLSFDWRYLVGQLIGAAVALVPMIAAPDFVAEFSGLSLVALLAYGWGAGDVGRTLQNGRGG